MIWATDHHGSRIKATPKAEGYCSLCMENLIPKCGNIKLWHWAHKKNTECDSWGEGETDWHINWKNEFPKECQEVTVDNHRADIKNKNGIVIELQNSSITSEIIHEREQHYKEMVWVINANTLAKGLEFRKKKDIITFRWKHPPKTWWEAEKPIYIDCGIWEKSSLFNGKPTKVIFELKKIYPNIPCGGWGRLISKEEFLRRFK